MGNIVLSNPTGSIASAGPTGSIASAMPTCGGTAFGVIPPVEFELRLIETGEIRIFEDGILVALNG